jgi:hypothetical protein
MAFFFVFSIREQKFSASASIDAHGLFIANIKSIQGSSAGIKRNTIMDLT